MQSTVLEHEATAEQEIPPAETPPKPAPKPGAYRLTSLDAFRGLTVFLMLLVNNIALDTQTPSQLTHAGWNGGGTIADLVFPWFLLCVGLAIPLSANSARKKGVPNWRHELRIVVRAG